jgi:hypothetical protein
MVSFNYKENWLMQPNAEDNMPFPDFWNMIGSCVEKKNEE